MPRTVFCRKYQQQLPGLDHPPFPGPKGQDIFEHISQQAWQEWTHHQTMLINEKHLNMMNTEHRKFIQAEMGKFFAGEEHATAEGYIVPDKK